MTQPVIRKSQTSDEPHGLIDKVISAVKHAHDEHVRHETLRHEHAAEEAKHLAEHKPEAERDDLPF